MTAVIGQLATRPDECRPISWRGHPPVRRLLIEAGLVVAGAETRNPKGWLALRLTWAGHDYLDTIRDPLIWRYTRRAAGRAGIWSLEMIATITKAAIAAKVRSIGLDLAA